MGGDTLGSMQQWRPTNLTVKATILPRVIRTVDPMLHVVVMYFFNRGPVCKPTFG